MRCQWYGLFQDEPQLAAPCCPSKPKSRSKRAKMSIHRRYSYRLPVSQQKKEPEGCVIFTLIILVKYPFLEASSSKPVSNLVSFKMWRALISHDIIWLAFTPRSSYLDDQYDPVPLLVAIQPLWVPFAPGCGLSRLADQVPIVLHDAGDDVIPNLPNLKPERNNLTSSFSCGVSATSW